MAFTLNANPASTTMNCYVTVSEADDYFTARFDSLDESASGTSVWAGFDVAKKTALLVSASRELDTFMYGGIATVASQPMQWPRNNVQNSNGYTYPNTSLPAKLKEATFELAYHRWTESDRPFSDAELEQLSSSKVGPLNYVARPGAKSFPSKVLDLLKAIGPGALVSSPGAGVKNIVL